MKKRWPRVILGGSLAAIGEILIVIRSTASPLAAFSLEICLFLLLEIYFSSSTTSVDLLLHPTVSTKKTTFQRMFNISFFNFITYENNTRFIGIQGR